jgi:hypothetical protein
VLLRLIGVFVLSTAALAVSAQPPIDTDGDGQISLPELQAVQPLFGADEFNSADTDADGYLSRDELRAMRRGRGEGPRDGRRGPPPMPDTDGDGALSLDELRALRPGMTDEEFGRLDRNGDGLLSPDERPRRGPRGHRDRARSPGVDVETAGATGTSV